MTKIVYILTNQSMPDTIKIGITDNLDRGIRELDNTSTPLPFECYYVIEVEAKKNERANAPKEVKFLCKEFGFTAGMLKGALAKG